MTLPKRLWLGSKDKKPKKGEGDRSTSPGGLFPFLPQKSCECSTRRGRSCHSQTPSCQALHMRRNKETELRKDILRASHRHSTGQSFILARQRVGEGSLKAFFQPLHYSKQTKSLTFLHQHPHDLSGAAMLAPAKACRRFSFFRYFLYPPPPKKVGPCPTTILLFL